MESVGCVLCGGRGSARHLELLLDEDVKAHYECLLFSSGLGQSGSEEEGLGGFLLSDIAREIKRGSRLKCVYCKEKGATVGCAKASCKKSYHLPCGMKNNSLQQYFDQYKSFCNTHRPVQKCKANEEAEKCGLCAQRLADLRGSRHFTALHSPCCSATFHRSCIQNYADNGRFKCPNCLNIPLFLDEMKMFGVYFPSMKRQNEDDEGVDNNGKRYCEAKLCFCDRSEGRGTNEKNSEWWEILKCFSCDRKGIHLKCGGMNEYIDPAWHCYTCRRKDHDDEHPKLKQFSDSPIRAVWGFAKGKKKKSKIQSTNNATIKEKRKLDPMKLSLTDIIVEGLNSESTWNLPSPAPKKIKSDSTSPCSSSTVTAPTDEGTSPGDSDYESENAMSPPKMIPQIIATGVPFNLYKKVVVTSINN